MNKFFIFNNIKSGIKNFINFLGYEIKGINKEIKNQTLDEILKQYLPKNPTIFDIGANKGQSIIRFQKIFKNPIIHSFEPIPNEFEILKKNFENNKNIKLNNFALGELEEYKDFNIAASSGTSSFNKINHGTKWLEVRSKQNNIATENYIEKVEKVKIKTLDDYCKINNINHIDLIKIDTQGYEDKVLEGSLNYLKDQKVSSIITEIMFDDIYDKSFTFSDIEKYLIPNGYRMVGIELSNNNLFSGLVFFADVLYFNKKIFKI